MIGLATLLVLLCAFGALWHSVRPLLDRTLALAERRVALDETLAGALTGTPVPTEKMPSDLALYTVSPAEPWARDEAASYVWGLYRQHHDWETVRHIVNEEERTRREQADAELSHIASSGMVQ